MDFSLFRIKVFRPSQKDAFARDRSASEILRQAILEKPTDMSLGARWHIGNVEEVVPDGLYFALGRAGRSRVPVLDEATGNFLETEQENAPYTQVVVDVPLEVAAIGHRSSLAPDVTGVARRLERLLAQTDVARNERVAFQVSPISLPESFIRDLQRAYAITSFTVTFTKPNPLDVEGDFLRPMERLAQEANGSNGSTTIRGVALDPQPLTELTRSAAATGDDAKAWIKPEVGQRSVKRSLRGDTAKITQDGLESREDRQSLLERLRTAYARVRGADRETA